MNWPLSNDYNEAVQHPSTAFADKDLRAGETPAGPLGIPVPRSGNFADVYQVKGGDGSVWAIKCFTRKVTGLRERYAKIDEHLKKLNLPFSVGFTYEEEGIRVKGAWYPIVKMEWVEGFTLNEFMRDNADKPQTLQAMLTMWCRLAKRLRESELAHADLQHGNVLLVPGFTAAKLGLKLIDYDGMWIPTLAGKHSGELGHSSYQHPFRSRDRLFGPDVDRFPHLVIAAALRGTILGGPAIWQAYDNGDNLLFREEDLKNPAESALFKKLAEFKDPALNCLIAHLAVSSKKPLDKTPWLDQVLPEDKAPILTPVQEKEAEQALGFALQKKGTATQKALETVPAKAVAAESWGDVTGAKKAQPNVFSDIPTKVVPVKKSKMPMIVGGLVAVAAIVGAIIAISGKKPKEDDIAKGPPVVLTKDSEKKKDEEKKADVTKKKDDGKTNGDLRKKDDPILEKLDAPAPAATEVAKEFKKVLEIAGEATLNALDFNGAGTALYWGSANDPKIHGYDLAANKPLPAFDAGSGVLSLRGTKAGSLVVQTAPNLYKFWKTPGMGEAELTTLPGELSFPQANATSERILYAHGNRVSYHDAPTMKSLGWPVHDAGRKIRHFELSPEGGIIVSVDDTGEIAVRLRNAGYLPLHFQDETKNSIRVAASPDSTLIAGYGIGNDVRVFSTLTGKPKFTVAHTAPVVDARFTPDGKAFVTIGKEKAAILWSLEGAKIDEVKLPEVPAALAVSRDGKRVAVATGDGPVARINLISLPYPGDSTPPRPDPSVVAVLPPVPSPDPKPKPDDSPKVKDGPGLVFDMPVDADAVRAIGFSGNSRKMVVVKRAGTAAVYEVDTMKHLGDIEIDKANCTAAAVNGNTLFAAISGKSIISPGKDNRIRMFDLDTLKMTRETDSGKTAIRILFPFGDGETILSRDDDCFRFWNIKTGKYSIYTVPASSVDPTRYVLSPLAAGRRLFTLDKGELFRWNADNGSNRSRIADLSGISSQLAISPGGTKIASVVYPLIRICDAGGKPLLDIPTGTDMQYGVHFVDQGRDIVTTGTKNGVRLYDVSNNIKGAVLFATYPGEFSLFETSAVSPDGNWYAQVSTLRETGMAVGRHRLTLWRLEKGEKKK